MWNLIAIRIRRSVSSTLRPVATQPGRSGQSAEKLFAARRTTTAYLSSIALPTHEPRLSQGGHCRLGMQILAALSCNRDYPALHRMGELSVTSTLPCDPPSIGLQDPDQLAHLHPAPNVMRPALRSIAGSMHDWHSIRKQRMAPFAVSLWLPCVDPSPFSVAASCSPGRAGRR